jgi:hypothetical protein
LDREVGVSEQRDTAERLLAVMDTDRAWSPDDAREAAGLLRRYIAERDVSARADGLTDEEGVVADALVQAVEAWARLPRQHPQEINEFVTAMHTCQGLLTTRIARRLYPDGWPVKS